MTLSHEYGGRFVRPVPEPVSLEETGFFRDAGQFELLRDSVVPRLIEKNRGKQRLRIWSAAACTGQEAYSMAMLLSEGFPELGGWDVRIVGTDVSRQWIEYARTARYRRLEVNRGLPARMLLKYMRRDGDEWEVTGAVRRMCEFHVIDACAPATELPCFDLVLLRNVLLYLGGEERTAAFRTVRRHLQPHGSLLLGQAEQAEDFTDLFEAEENAGCCVYRPVAKEYALA